MASLFPQTKDATTDWLATTYLLELPGELRNRIYRHALVNHSDTLVNADTFQQPPLLRTCNQIRAEASSIYYSENDFSFVVKKFKSGAAASWWQHGHPNIHHINQVFYRTHGIGTRADFVSWLQRVHTQHLPILIRSRNPQDRRMENHLAFTFNTAKMLRGLPWEIVKQVLENEIDTLLYATSVRFEEQNDADSSA